MIKVEVETKFIEPLLTELSNGKIIYKRKKNYFFIKEKDVEEFKKILNTIIFKIDPNYFFESQISFEE